MKRNIVILIGVLALGLSTARSQTVLLNSWDDSTQGWSILETSAWTSDGFATNGAPQGDYSWELTASGVDYGATLAGPASTNVTYEMANASSVSMNILVSTNPVNAGAEFNWGIQIDLEINQPGGAGSISVDGYDYPGDVYSPQLTSGTVNTISFSVSQAVRTALDENPGLPTYLTLSVGGGGGGTIYINNLEATEIPAVQGSVWVRELWDDLPGEEIPAEKPVTNDTSTVGFVSSDPWMVNPADTTNGELMAFRAGFANDPESSGDIIGLPGTLDNTSGSLVQENSGFGFGGGNSFWDDGDFMTRPLDPSEYINFNAVGEYWFAATLGNSTTGVDAQYVTFPASGWAGLGFADGGTTNADFVAIGVSGLNVYIGPTNSSYPWGETNLSSTLYISQGTLGQPGNTNSTAYNPLLDPSANPPDSPPSYAPPYNSEYTETNFTGGPYHLNAWDTNSATVGTVQGNDIILLGHLKTYGNGTATLDAKYYTLTGGSSWNYSLDTNPGTIQWDCHYSFNYGGTMTRMLLFENGQFPIYVFGFRAGTNFNEVVGLDPGYILVTPLTNTFVGYPINMTNFAVEAPSSSFVSAPPNYGTLTYQWYQNGLPISGATSQSLNIASASTNDPSMPGGHGCRRLHERGDGSQRHLGIGHQFGDHHGDTIESASGDGCADVPQPKHLPGQL